MEAVKARWRQRATLPAWAWLFVAAFVLLPLAITLPMKSFTADDFWFAGYGNIPGDPSICSVPAAFAGDWLSGLQHRGGWLRPLPRALFLLNDTLFGIDRPWGYHLTNGLLHLGSVLLVGAIAQALIRGRLGRRDARRALPSALVAAALFGVYPPTTGAVSWVSGRTDLLAVFFLLAATLSGALPMALAARMVAVFAATTLAILSKESGYFTVPMVGAFLLVLRRHPLRVLPELAASAVAAAIMLAWRFHCLGGMGGYPDQFGGKPLAQLALWPVRFVGVVVQWQTFYGLFAVAAMGLLAAGMAAIRSSAAVRSAGRALLFGAAALAIGAVPVWGLALLPVENDRFFYLPAVGFALVMAGAAHLAMNAKGRAHAAGAVLLIALVFVSVLDFFRRDITWTNASRITESVIKRVERIADANPDPKHLPLVVVFRNMDMASYESDALQQVGGAKVLPWDQVKWGLWRLSHGRHIADWGLARKHLGSGAWLAYIDEAEGLYPVLSFRADAALTSGTLVKDGVYRLRFRDLERKLPENELTYAAGLARLRGDVSHLPAVVGNNRRVMTFNAMPPGQESDHFFPLGLEWTGGAPWEYRPADGPGKISVVDFAVALFPLHEVTLPPTNAPPEPGS